MEHNRNWSHAWRGAVALGTLALILGAAGCGGGTEDAEPSGALPEGAEAFSLLGELLHPNPAPPEIAARQARDVREARADYEADPDDADAIIRLGRRVAYMGSYREAIEIFSEGVEKHPDDARMYRHRGHRWISVREFDRAIEDLSHAAGLVRGEPDEVEPDGQPNERGIPTSTLQSNIHYHLALALYLKGDFEAALASYEAYNAVTTNPDQLVAISHWWFMALRRLGRDAEAAAVLEPVTADLDVIENTSYHRLLLMYKGELTADDLWDPASEDPSGVAIAYGVATWHLYNGREVKAEEMYRRILQGSGWAGFGYIGAEAEIARLEAGGA
ncbi:hypothetical protein [Candidatus Palauibacter sp.]|uniref:hypothetical protein n=1 Tax=Candidatus Palauibacter sp. TaxID=3101350 RepID=UPI003AF2BBDC